LNTLTLANVIRQIRYFAPVFNDNVAGAADFARGVFDQAWLPLPAAYVVPGEAESAGNENLNATFQRVTRHVDVIVVLDNSEPVGDRRGQTQSEQTQVYEFALHAALLGWRPTFDPTGLGPYPDPTQNREARGFYFTGSAMARELERARMFWRVSYAIDEIITEADGWQPPTAPFTDITATVFGDGTIVTQVTMDIPLPQPGDP